MGRACSMHGDKKCAHKFWSGNVKGRRDHAWYFGVETFWKVTTWDTKKEIQEYHGGREVDVRSPVECWIIVRWNVQVFACVSSAKGHHEACCMFVLSDHLGSERGRGDTFVIGSDVVSSCWHVTCPPPYSNFWLIVVWKHSSVRVCVHVFHSLRSILKLCSCSAN
jgi:hypothetical protein